MKKIESFEEFLKLPTRKIVCLSKSDGNCYGIISPDHIAYEAALFKIKDDDGRVSMHCYFMASRQQGEIFRIYKDDFPKYQLFIMEADDITENEIARYLHDQKPVNWFSRTISKMIFNFLFKLKERVTREEAIN